MADNGRPSKFTADVRDKVIFALRVGNFRRTAAEYAGIHERTLADWLWKGSQEDGTEHASFHRDVIEAERMAEIRALGVIQQAAQKGDWKAAAWFLEKKFPDRFCTRAALLVAQRRLANSEPNIDGMDEEETERFLFESLRELTRAGMPLGKLIAAVTAEDAGDDPGGTHIGPGGD